MPTESELQSKLAKQKNAMLKQIRVLQAKTRVRVLQQQYDSKVIKTFLKVYPEQHAAVIKELKPAFEKLKADKKVVFDETERMRKKGMWIKTKKKKPKN